MPEGASISLSNGQRSMWLIQEANPECTAYNVILPVFVEGSLDTEAVGRAVKELVSRHPVLAGRIDAEHGEPRYVRDEDLVPTVVEIDLFSAEREAAVREFQAYVDLEGRSPFALQTEAPLRVSLVRGPDFYVIVFWLHHVVTDASSVQIILDDFVQAYEMSSEGAAASPAAASPDTVPDAGSGLVGDGETALPVLDDWQQYLAGAPAETTYPRTRPRDERFSFRGERLTAELSGLVTRRLLRFARDRRVTPFTCLMTAVAVVIGVAAGQRDLVLGATVSHRSVNGGRREIGYEAALVPVRITLDVASLGGMVDQVANNLAKSYAMASVPFDVIVQHLGTVTSARLNPLCQVVCNFVTPIPPFRVGGQDAKVLQVHNGSAKFDLTVDLLLHPGKAEVLLEYCSTLYTRAEAEAFLSKVVDFLAVGVTDPDALCS